MKSKKAKPEKKAAKKSNKRVVKKELEASMTSKFLDVIKNLGHEAGNLTKDVKKLSKQLAKKLADKVSSIGDSPDTPKRIVRKKTATPIKRAVKAPNTGLSRAEKVVAKAKTTSVAKKTMASTVKVAQPVKIPAVRKTMRAVPKESAASTRGVTVKMPKPRTIAAKPAAQTPRKPRVKRTPPLKATTSPPVNSNDNVASTSENINSDRTNNTDVL
ncbi:MAG TPA: hypothetical protein VNI52_01335 [Sphingobacteriaceae bacterium]|nr:hypothetical protein [Sphingobacteriaceae bacterium]